MNQEEFTTNQEIAEEEMITAEVEIVEHQAEKSFKSAILVKSKWLYLISIFFLFIAVIVLYILHFTSPKPHIFAPIEIPDIPRSGEIVYVDLDVINEKYELVTILTGDIKSEMAKQEAIFANKESTFQRKYAQFQENLSTGVLTDVQIEYAQKQLMQEYQQLESDKERVFDNLQARQAAALVQIYDSLQATVKRINLERNASYIITYQNQSPFLLVTDPAKDITEYVLYELNRSYKK